MKDKIQHSSLSASSIHALFGFLFSRSPSPNSTPEASGKEVGDCRGLHESVSYPQGSATRIFRVLEETPNLEVCTSRKTTRPAMNDDKGQVSHRRSTHLQKSAYRQETSTSGAASQASKYNPRVRLPARLMILGGCAYGPALPMWYLSTTSLQPPIWLLLATQGWLAMSLGLLAWSWISREGFSPNVEGMARRANESRATESQPDPES